MHVDDDEVATILSEIADRKGNSERVVFVSGNFNVIHPGHLRLLNFAADCGDVLVVGVTRDDTPGVLVPESLRLAGVRAINGVDYALLLPDRVEDFVAALKPEVVVKGKEHEAQENPEQAIIDSYGGKLIFSSGDVRFSSMDLLRRELYEVNPSSIRPPADFPQRHGFGQGDLLLLIDRFASLRVVVIGDLIVDEYITCDPLGMSQEDPSIVVTPIKRDMFVGGAGIVAAHARALGAHVDYVAVVGSDATAEFAAHTLTSYGVVTHLVQDVSRPTTLKQRYRAGGKTLLRVSHLRQHDIGHALVEAMCSRLEPLVDRADLVVFSDFNYGCLPQALIDQVWQRCSARGLPMVADSQSSSQVGDISRFKGMLLVTPTEYEARLAIREPGAGLVVLADTLQRQSEATHVFITLGAEGLLIHTSAAGSSGLQTDQLPAFNESPKDVAGAGDCLLIASALSMVAGASVWQSAYLGSVAAACQVGRVGNLPLAADDLRRELKS